MLNQNKNTTEMLEIVLAPNILDPPEIVEFLQSYFIVAYQVI